MKRKYGLLGHPLGHSFSKNFHNKRFFDLGIEAEYVNFDLENIDLLKDVLENENNLQGLNVTIPYKQQVMSYLDELDPVAERIGAVNTVVISRSIPQGKMPKNKGLWLKGYNTDIIGFRDTIVPLLHASGILNDEKHINTKALILGTGGASKAVYVALEDLGIQAVFVSRSEGKDKITYQQLEDVDMNDYRVIVNCSPVGMFPHVDEAPNIPYHKLNKSHVCYDLIYNPELTQFLLLSQERGARIMSGGAMLEGQAIASYRYWTSEEK